MTDIRRGMVVDIDLDPTKGSETGKIRPCIVVTNDKFNRHVPVIQIVPITAWNEKKIRILTNVEIEPDKTNRLNKISIADCLQTRPVDHRKRLVRVRGKVGSQTLTEIDAALKIVFALN